MMRQDGSSQFRINFLVMVNGKQFRGNSTLTQSAPPCEEAGEERDESCLMSGGDDGRPGGAVGVSNSRYTVRYRQDIPDNLVQLCVIPVQTVPVQLKRIRKFFYLTFVGK